MRVNVQYTVELDQIPKEMKKLLKYSVVDKLRDALRKLEEIDLNSSQAADSISDMRVALFQADERLSDVDAIIKGYCAQKMETEPRQSQPQIEPTGNLPVDTETMADVKARLAEHQLETDALKRTFQNWGALEENSPDGDS